MLDTFKIVGKESANNEYMDTANFLKQFITACIAKSSNLRDIVGQNSPETSLLLLEVKDFIETLQRCVDSCILKYLNQVCVEVENSNDLSTDEEFINLATILEKCIKACVENSPAKHEFQKSFKYSRNCDDISALESCTDPTLGSGPETAARNKTTLHPSGSTINCDSVLLQIGSTPHCDETTLQLSESVSNGDGTSLQLSRSTSDCVETTLQQCGTTPSCDETTFQQSDPTSDSDKTRLQPNYVQGEEGIQACREKSSALKTSVMIPSASNEFTEAVVVPRSNKESALDHSEQENKTSQSGNKRPTHFDELTQNKDTVHMTCTTINKTIENSEKMDTRLMPEWKITQLPPHCAQSLTEPKGLSQDIPDATSVSYQHRIASTGQTTILHNFKENSNFNNSTCMTEPKIISLANSTKLLMSPQTTTWQTSEEIPVPQKLQVLHCSNEAFRAEKSMEENGSFRKVETTSAMQMEQTSDEAIVAAKSMEENTSGMQEPEHSTKRLLTPNETLRLYNQQAFGVVSIQNSSEYNPNPCILIQQLVVPAALCKCEICGAQFINSEFLLKHKLAAHSVTLNENSQDFSSYMQDQVMHIKEEPEESSLQMMKSSMSEYCVVKEKDAIEGKGKDTIQNKTINNKHSTVDVLLKENSQEDVGIVSGMEVAGIADFNMTCEEIDSGPVLEDSVIASESNLLENLKIDPDCETYNCNICGKIFVTSTGLLCHRKRVHINNRNTKLYKCDICEEQFTKKWLLTKHIKSHDEKLNSCDICGKKFKDPYSIKRHISLLHNSSSLASLKCKFCDEVCTDKADLLKHRSLHYAQKLFTCGICGMQFSQPTSYLGHRKKHEEGEHTSCLDAEKYSDVDSFSDKNLMPNTDKQFQCDVCDKVFPKATGLKTHRKIHFRTQTFKCSICGKVLANSNSYSQHLQLQHSEDTGNAYQCNVCGKEFRLLYYLRKHRRVHTDNIRSKCDICGKQCQDSASLKVHKRIHTKEKPYQCEFCENRFSQLPHLTRHRRIHTGEKPYKCEICGQGFAVKDYLTNHKRVHQEDFPFQCELCGKCFKLKNLLASHTKSHNDGESKISCDVCGKMFGSYSALKLHKSSHTRPHQCDTCGKKFGQSNNLKFHMMSHTGERPYVCGLCGKGFKVKASLSEHTMAVHYGKKFECNICHATLTNSNNLSRHKLIHLIVGKPHQCDICGKEFREKRFLNTHLKTHENNKTKTSRNRNTQCKLDVEYVEDTCQLSDV